MSDQPPEDDIPPHDDQPPPEDGSYDVGYGKPPKAHQFKKGQSGNPKGRPKGSKNLETIVSEELDRQVTITQNGEQKKIKKIRLAVRQQADKAAKGDGRAFLALAKLMRAGEHDGAGDGAGGAPRAVNTGVSDEQYDRALAALIARKAPEVNHDGR